MYVIVARTRKGLSAGFTMVELLMVIVTIAIISIVAMPKFLDFRLEARVATAQNYSNNLKSSLISKKTQMMVRCDRSADFWPRVEAIRANDITEAGDPGAHCTLEQLGNDLEAARFFGQAEVTVPVNPYNDRSDIVVTACMDLCECADDGGYLYNPSTGLFGHPLLANECVGRTPASASSSDGDSEESAGSDGSDGSDGSESSACVPTYEINELELCENSCTGDLVNNSFCEEEEEDSCNCRDDGGGVTCTQTPDACTCAHGQFEGNYECGGNFCTNEGSNVSHDSFWDSNCQVSSEAGFTVNCATDAVSVVVTGTCSVDGANVDIYPNPAGVAICTGGGYTFSAPAGGYPGGAVTGMHEGQSHSAYCPPGPLED